MGQKSRPARTAPLAQEALVQDLLVRDNVRLLLLLLLHLHDPGEAVQQLRGLVSPAAAQVGLLLFLCFVCG